jgi:hypothetical protein
MYTVRAVLLTTCLIVASACMLPAGAQERAPVKATEAYDQFLTRLQTVDVNSPESVGGAFGVALVLRYRSPNTRLWVAEVPASDRSPRLFLDYRERIPPAGPGQGALVITLPEPSYSLATARRRHPNLRLTSPPGHSVDSGWGYEIPGGANAIGVEFDANLRYLISITVVPRR